ncbi:MAG: HAD-IIIC family phosphatase [Ginsengibacter sp.]
MELINNLPFNEVIAEVNKFSKVKSENPSIRIAVLRNITADNYLVYLKYLLYTEGFQPVIFTGDYDSIIQESLNEKSALYQFEPDIIIILNYGENLVPDLYSKFTDYVNQKGDDLKDNILNYYKSILSGIRKFSDAKIIVNNLGRNMIPVLGIYESQNHNGQNQVINTINFELITLAKEEKNVFVLDIERIANYYGFEKFYDQKQWYIAKNPYSLTGHKAIAWETKKIVNAINGKIKKCLVLDCDNTLWGGIVGEVGVENIQISNTYPGNIYLAFQQQILNLYSRGIILAINSKNNFEDVKEVLDKHPSMLLKEKHFASIYANWDNKADNLKAIAHDLNIGLDSMVFVDDSDFECSFVKEMLPQVSVICLPKDRTQFSSIFSSSGYFDSLSFSSEDLKRGQLYRSEIDRKKEMVKFTDLNSFYRSLEMELEIFPADNFSIPRVAQLSQRTNQFNLTTKRYSEDEIKNMVNSDDFSVLCLKLADKFGDLGIVGVCIIDFSKNYALIDTFFMSCRIINRGIETIFLQTALNKAFDKGLKTVKATFSRTKKNQLVESFYENQGFSTIKKTDEKIEYSYSIDKNVKMNGEIFKTIKI